MSGSIGKLSMASQRQSARRNTGCGVPTPGKPIRVSSAATPRAYPEGVRHGSTHSADRSCRSCAAALGLGTGRRRGPCRQAGRGRGTQVARGSAASPLADERVRPHEERLALVVHGNMECERARHRHGLPAGGRSVPGDRRHVDHVLGVLVVSILALEFGSP